MSPSRLDPAELLAGLAAQQLTRVLGVPDSTLGPFLRVLEGDVRFDHLRATNECEAMAIALGQYLATGQPSVVYLQNSGFGKTIHPITSLLSAEVGRVPALLLIGWRGEPGGPKDEPQHQTMGRVMPALLEAIDVPWEVLVPGEVAAALARAQEHMATHGAPYALVVRPGIWLEEPATPTPAPAGALTRMRALELLVEQLPATTAYVATTGKASRELYALREARAESHDPDFYTVGGMGCASSIGLGIARELGARRPVCVLDGDGAALMQLGSMASLGHAAAPLLHVLLDNAAYESTGGQPSISPTVDFVAVARACGYPWARRVASEDGLRAVLDERPPTLGLLVIQVAAWSAPGLGRPRETPRENVARFRQHLAR